MPAPPIGGRLVFRWSANGFLVQLKAVAGKALATPDLVLSQFHGLQEVKKIFRSCLAWWPLASLKRLARWLIDIKVAARRSDQCHCAEWKYQRFLSNDSGSTYGR